MEVMKPDTKEDLIVCIFLAVIVCATLYLPSYGRSEIEAEPANIQTEAAPTAKRYATVAEYFRAGNPNPTTYRLGEPQIKRKNFSKKVRETIHRENGGVWRHETGTGPYTASVRHTESRRNLARLEVVLASFLSLHP